jgi:hypothetical protein
VVQRGDWVDPDRIVDEQDTVPVPSLRDGRGGRFERVPHKNITAPERTSPLTYSSDFRTDSLVVIWWPKLLYRFALAHLLKIRCEELTYSKMLMRDLVMRGRVPLAGGNYFDSSDQNFVFGTM